MKLRVVRQFNRIIASFPLLRKMRTQHPISFWILLSSVLFVMFVLLIFLLEGRWRNKPITSLLETVRLVFVLFLGEYGDDKLNNPLTQFVTVLALIVGIAIFSAILGNLASYLVGKKLEVTMPEDLEKHIVICNWNSRGDRVVKELHSTTATPETEIIVIADKDINEKELRSSSEYEKVYFVRSDPTMHEVLEKARAHLAQCVIILADDDCTNPDAKSALISLAIKSLANKTETLRKPHIVAEILNHQKIRHLKDAGVDEWVCSVDYGLGIIAQCALHRKLSNVYQQLLTYSEDTNEIYLIGSSEYPKDFLGKDFKQLSKMLNNNRGGNNPTILLGVKRDDHIILNPRLGEFDNLKRNDSLIVLAFTKPDLKYYTNRQKEKKVGRLL